MAVLAYPTWKNKPFPVYADQLGLETDVKVKVTENKQKKYIFLVIGVFAYFLMSKKLEVTLASVPT